jgi:hypothetical protein
MKVSKPRTRLACELILVAFLASLFLFRGFLPAWRSLNTDFPNYFVAASIHRAGIPLDRAYEWTWFQRQKDHLGIDQALVGFAPHPPLCALPFIPVAGMQALNAKRVWLICNLGFLALVFWILRRATKLSWLHVILISLLCITPLRTNLLDGQYYILILLLICAAYYALRENHNLSSGLLLSVGAGLKLFPGLFLILFLWKRNWRAATGLILGFLALTAISIGVFGWNVHQVYVTEVLPRAVRGELLAPYSSRWSALTPLLHRMFLFEPELNPTPLLNSAVLFSIFQAVTPVILWFSYLMLVSRKDESGSFGLEWAAFVPLTLLLNPMPSSYHYCVLIFSAVVGLGALREFGNRKDQIVLLAFFVAACFPPYGELGTNLPAVRLFATLGMFVLILRVLSGSRKIQFSLPYASAAFAMILILFAANLHALAYRNLDFQRRVAIPTQAFRYADPIGASGQKFLFTEMLIRGYVAAVLDDQHAAPVPLPGDALSLAGSPESSIAYAEAARLRSSIYRLDVPSKSTNQVTEGFQPAMSANGRWLAFLRKEEAGTSVWLIDTMSEALPQRIYDSTDTVFEITLTPEGDLILAKGSVISSRLFHIRRETKTISPIENIAGSVRYPALSSDGTRLAFSRRDHGSWHLSVQDLKTGAEQQLTGGPCNAISPSWESGNTLLYATDCGRGLGLSAIARVRLDD